MPRSSMAAKPKMIPPGVFCPVVTLYKPTPRQEIDLDACYKYFSYLIRGGVDGLVLQGSTAEAVLLAPEERIALTKTARRAAQDLGATNFPIVAGSSGQSTNESIRLAKDAADAGADFALILPPSYWPKAVTKNVIVGFFQEVADNSPIPVVIYNFPGVCAGIDLSSDVLSTLAQHPNIVGAKLTCGLVGKVSRLSEEYTPAQFSVFGGQSDWLLSCLLSGGVGCVTGVGNVFPKCVVHLYSLWKQGKTEEATKLQGVIGQGEKACKEGLGALKFAAGNFAGPAAGVTDPVAFYPRKPYLPAGKDLQNWIVEVMQHLVELEQSLPDAYGPPTQQSNGVH